LRWEEEDGEEEDLGLEGWDVASGGVDDEERDAWVEREVVSVGAWVVWVVLVGEDGVKKASGRWTHWIVVDWQPMYRVDVEEEKRREKMLPGRRGWMIRRGWRDERHQICSGQGEGTFSSTYNTIRDVAGILTRIVPSPRNKRIERRRRRMRPKDSKAEKRDVMRMTDVPEPEINQPLSSTTLRTLTEASWPLREGRCW
jgi:hypothetical protein